MHLCKRVCTALLTPNQVTLVQRCCNYKAEQDIQHGLVYLIIPPISTLTPLRFSAASLVTGSLSG